MSDTHGQDGPWGKAVATFHCKRCTGAGRCTGPDGSGRRRHEIIAGAGMPDKHTGRAGGVPMARLGPATPKLVRVVIPAHALPAPRAPGGEAGLASCRAPGELLHGSAGARGVGALCLRAGEYSSVLVSCPAGAAARRAWCFASGEPDGRRAFSRHGQDQRRWASTPGRACAAWGRPRGACCGKGRRGRHITKNRDDVDNRAIEKRTRPLVAGSAPDGRLRGACPGLCKRLRRAVCRRRAGCIVRRRAADFGSGRPAG